MKETASISDSSPKTPKNAWQKMADEVLAEKQNHTTETSEKIFFETEAEFNPSKIKEFRETLLNANEETTKKILDSRISFLEKNCDKIKSVTDQKIHRGYIGKETSVKYQTGISFFGSEYKIHDTEYLFEAVNIFQKNKQSIKNGADLFNGIEIFLNNYFGFPDSTTKDKRLDVVDRKIGDIDSYENESEYFDKILNLDISIFKGEHAAQCSERTAMAQNILSLFGYETYFVIGDANINGKSEGHAFNIVTDNIGKKAIMDFSITSAIEYRGTHWFFPTSGEIPNFNAFKQGYKVTATSYEKHIDETGKIHTDNTRNIEYNASI